MIQPWTWRRERERALGRLEAALAAISASPLLSRFGVGAPPLLAAPAGPELAAAAGAAAAAVAALQQQVEQAGQVAELAGTALFARKSY